MVSISCKQHLLAVKQVTDATMVVRSCRLLCHLVQWLPTLLPRAVQDCHGSRHAEAGQIRQGETSALLTGRLVLPGFSTSQPCSGTWFQGVDSSCSTAVVRAQTADDSTAARHAVYAACQAYQYGQGVQQQLCCAVQATHQNPVLAKQISSCQAAACHVCDSQHLTVRCH